MRQLLFFYTILTLLSGNAVSSDVPKSAPTVNSSGGVRAWLDQHDSGRGPESIGVGALYGNSGNEDEMAFVLGGDHFVFPSIEDKGFWKKTYGFDHLRLEVGTGFGAGLMATGGFQLLGPERDELFFPHLGIEPFNLFASVNTNSSREDFIEWMPMGSAGGHFEFGLCSLIALGRAGGAIGTLGDGGARAAWGAGTYLICGMKFGMAFELTRILFKNRLPIELPVMATAYSITNHDVTLGVRAEGVGTYLKSSPEPTERRLFITVSKQL